jgi:hypothetical protein
MSVTREQIMTALLALLQTTAEYKLVSRRNRAPSTITPALSPALFLFEDAEAYKRPSPSLPPVRTLTAKAVIYNNVGPDPNQTPTSIVNAALDALDVALAPDNSVTGRCTLGGLVYSAMIDGEIVKAPGDMTGVALAIAPIRIVIP